MPNHKVSVKWGNQTFPDINLNTDLEPTVFKAQLFKLTGVAPERQKVIIKGAIIKDESWESVATKIDHNTLVLMMGSIEEDVPPEPMVTPLNLENVLPEYLIPADLPMGLPNLGNTCYLNATLQCLKAVPELRARLKTFHGGLSKRLITAQSVTAAIRDLYEMMDQGIAIPPIMLLEVLQMAIPRFAEKNENGMFVQQDANECWSEIIRMLRQKLPATSKNGFLSKYEFFIDQFFGGVFEVEWKCDECEEEHILKTEETFLQLSCFISRDVGHVKSGLKSKLQEKIVKYSQCLNRNAVFTKTTKIKRLPAYLTIQLERFCCRKRRAVNAKILKDVRFSFKFDAHGLCTSELQRSLRTMRRKFKEWRVQKDLMTRLANYQLSLPPPIPNAEEEFCTTAELRRFRRVKPYQSRRILKGMIKKPFSFFNDLGSNNSGYYSLRAVISHHGSSSSSGHYVAWVKQADERWLKCDDGVVTQVHAIEVLKLCGGGDRHCACMLIYGPEILEMPVYY